MAQDMSS